MDIYNELIHKKSKLSVIGLGYVGLPLAVAFDNKVDVIGFDIDDDKIQQYKKGVDITSEIGDDILSKSSIIFTNDENRLKECIFHIVAVPTPINYDKTPDLNPIIESSRIVGRNIKKGSIVVYESTVYPGVTEEICIPILEEESALKCGEDFKVGYSPERINPGDKTLTLSQIVKIVSGMDEEATKTISNVYKMIIEAGVYEAESIKVAEAAKVIENSQRDVNIAFINEIATVFEKMNIDTQAVINAASTKWNFINLKPGLVGGHCIGVDPYYFIYKANQLGLDLKLISAGRNINDGMAKHIAENTIKSLIKANKNVRNSKIAILGISFKENCPDIRNTKVIDLIKELQEYDIDIIVTDSIASNKDTKKEYGIELKSISEISDVDGIIIAVAHNEYKQMTLKDFNKLYKKNINLEKNERHVFIDIKGIMPRNTFNKDKYVYWRL